VAGIRWVTGLFGWTGHHKSV
jgi:hypothetical protein